MITGVLAHLAAVNAATVYSLKVKISRESFQITHAKKEKKTKQHNVLFLSLFRLVSYHSITLDQSFVKFFYPRSFYIFYFSF